MSDGSVRCGRERRGRAEAPDDLAALNKKVEVLYSQGKYAEASDIAKKSLALVGS